VESSQRCRGEGGRRRRLRSKEEKAKEKVKE